MRMRLWMAVVVVLAVAPAAFGQHTNPPTTGLPTLDEPTTARSPVGTSIDADPGRDPMRAKMEAERMRAQNDDRHKRLAADAAKLLALATELKAEVDKTDKNELSVTVVKKAAEMEKLARDLKDRMRE